MRSLILIIIVLLILFSASFAGYHLVSSISTDILDDLEILEEHITAGNWEEAREKEKEITAHWDKANAIFPIIIDHEQLHDLHITLARISALLELEEQKKLIPEIRIARDLISSISHEEKPLLKNIF